MARITRQAGLILLYHRVRDDLSDPDNATVTPEHFELQVGHLKSYFELHTLEEVASKRRGIALTFDDAYPDFASFVLPFLRSEGIPATVFVVCDASKNRQIYWWDELREILERASGRRDHVEVEIDNSSLWLALATPADVFRAYRAVHVRIRRFDLDPQQVIGVLRSALGVFGPVSTPPPLDEKQIKALASDPLVEIGAHTLTHPRLPSLTAEDQRREIEDGRSYLRRLTGGPITSFAYPFGDFDRTSVASVRSAGFKIACTAIPGAVRKETHRLMIPRCIVRNWGVAELAARLESWVDEKAPATSI